MIEECEKCEPRKEQSNPPKVSFVLKIFRYRVKPNLRLMKINIRPILSESKVLLFPICFGEIDVQYEREGNLKTEAEGGLDGGEEEKKKKKKRGG